MQKAVGAYITLMSEFSASFDSSYVEYIDRDSAKVITEKSLEPVSDESFKEENKKGTFEKYLDYMDRKKALQSKPKLEADEILSLQTVTEKIEELSAVEKNFLTGEQLESQKKLDSLESGMFDLNSNDLKKSEVDNYKELFSQASENESVLFQDVISFETQALIDAGIYNPKTNELKREPLILASRKMINTLVEMEGLNESTVSVGEIHYNTDHFHIHFATTEVEPTREKVFIKEKNQYERKGLRDEYTLEKMRSVFANTIFDRTSELERLNNLRNGLRTEIKDELAKPNDKKIVLLDQLKNELPENKKKWFAKSLTPKGKEVMNELIDELMKDNPNFEEFKRIAKEEDIIKSETFGTLSENKQSFYEGRMYGENGIYYRLGNSILQELKSPSSNKEDELAAATKKIIQSSPSHRENFEKYQSYEKNLVQQKKNGNSPTTYYKIKSGQKEGSIDSDYRKRSPPLTNIFYKRSLLNDVKRLERVTSNEVQQYQNEMEYEKLQREIAQSQNQYGDNLL